jgi:tetratricopeptide (TPR) repeat protein
VRKQGNNYTVLTAAHVVKDKSQPYTVVTGDQQRYSVNVSTIKVLKNIDLAVVQFTSARDYQTVVVGNSDEAIEGSIVYVAGFPKATAAITRSIYNFTEGKVTANASQPLADGYSLVYSNNTLPGTSGGAVLNENGELIAIHGKGDAAESSRVDPINSQIRIKTGFNLGIATRTLNQFASNLGLVTDLTPSSTAQANQTSRNARAADFLLAAADKSNRGDWLGAIRDLDQAININARYAAAYLARGELRYNLGQLVSARQDLEQAIRLDSSLAIAHNDLCLLYGDFGELDRAIASCQRAIQLDGKLAMPYNNLGLVYFYRKNLDAAVQNYTIALQRDPNLAITYNNRGFAYANQGKLTEALADYNQALAVNPQLAMAYSNRGLLEYQRRNFAPALSDFTQAIKLSPNTALFYHNRGSLLGEQGKLLESLADFNQAIKLNPKMALAYQNRGSVLILLGRDTEGRADLQTAAKLLKEQGDRANYETQITRPKQH